MNGKRRYLQTCWRAMLGIVLASGVVSDAPAPPLRLSTGSIAWGADPTRGSNPSVVPAGDRAPHSRRGSSTSSDACTVDELTAEGPGDGSAVGVGAIPPEEEPAASTADAATDSESEADEPARPQRGDGRGQVGSLVIIGGSERFDQTIFWEEIVRLAGGPGARIAVLPTASSDPYRKGGWVVQALNKAGGDAFVVPLAWRKTAQSPHEIADDPVWAERVRQATGVFMIGGEQERITRALYRPDGDRTELLEAMWDVFHNGGVISGTSAGAAVMSRIMFRDAESVLQTLHQGVRMGQEIDRGLGFLDHDWFVDQHCLVRGRFARAIVAMQDQGLRYGIGVDENTGVVVERGHEVKVIGYKGALIFDLSRAERDEQQDRFNIRNVRLTYLDRGDRFDLKTMEVTPSDEKLNDDKLDPNSPDFRPLFRRKMFFNDILGNQTVADLMGMLIDSIHSQAIGLAFDGDLARREPVDGFEFVFERDENSVGWYTEVFGGDDYTVLNIRLDIRPIRFTGPLYQPAN